MWEVGKKILKNFLITIVFLIVAAEVGWYFYTSTIKKPFINIGKNEVVEVKEGTCVKVLPNAVRTMEAKTDMEYICVQAKSNSLEQFGLGDAELC